MSSYKYGPPHLALEDLLATRAEGKTNFQIVAVAEGDIKEPNHISA
jgi:hypothetical protein